MVLFGVEGQVADARGRGKQVHRAAGCVRIAQHDRGAAAGKARSGRPVARRRPGVVAGAAGPDPRRSVLDRQFRRRLRSDGVLAAESLGRLSGAFIAQHDPAEIRGRAVEPLLHVRQHRGTGRTRPGKRLVSGRPRKSGQSR